uniref:hypothetical protein n=1 Tax=Sporichthya sp. TaxID=65475 RepID=UPI0017D78109
MGVNNRQRRAAKAKQRTKERRTRAAGHSPGEFGSWGSPVFDDRDVIELALLGWLARVAADPGVADAAATDLLTGGPGHRRLVVEVVTGALESVLPALTAGGWTPDDLRQVLRRRVGGGA